jgi:hypothetical protein
MLDKRGFLFTVTVFLILVYILLSISVWVKAVETSERAYAEFYKESTVELTIEQITPEKLDEVTRIIMNRALIRLNDHSVEHSVDQGPPVDENKNIREALFELLVNGSADASHFRGDAPIPPEENSSLRGWVNNLNASLRAIGIYVNEFDVPASSFHVGQNDIDKLNYSFDMKLGLKDYSNTSAVSRTYHLANNLSIIGLVDPALARESRTEAGDNDTVYRQFFFNKTLYSDYTDITVDKMSQTVEGGQGWLYGPLAMANGSGNLVPEAGSIAPISGNRRIYILVGTYDEIKELTPSVYESFAGYIITNTATITADGCAGGRESDTFNPIKHSAPPNCTPSFNTAGGIISGKPFIVAPGFNASSAPECPTLDGTNLTRRCVLMLSRYLQDEVKDDPPKKLAASSVNGIYEVETFRDFVMCGYYTHNPKAPSYLHRLMNDSYARNSTEFGIETFVIGNYANDYSVYDTNSRLDRELFEGGIAGIKIRGLPGCREFPACSDTPTTGIFAVSDDTKDDYGLDDIACDNGAAGCD